MDLHFFDAQTLAATPWKNGGGLTKEIVCVPQGASLDHFDWRLSIAQIDASGPFSVFLGVDRTIMLLAGAGVRLEEMPGQEADLRADRGLIHCLATPYQPFNFAGERVVWGGLIDGPTQDLNLMTRRGVCAANVGVYASTTQQALTNAGFLMALSGPWRVLTPLGEEIFLTPNQGYWWNAPRMDSHKTLPPWTMEPCAPFAHPAPALLCAAITPH